MEKYVSLNNLERYDSKVKDYINENIPTEQIQTIVVTEYTYDSRDIIIEPGMFYFIGGESQSGQLMEDVTIYLNCGRTESIWLTLPALLIVSSGNNGYHKPFISFSGKVNETFMYSYTGNLLVNHAESYMDSQIITPVLLELKELGGGGFDPTSITGYDATKKQRLLNETGTLKWVEDHIDWSEGHFGNMPGYCTRDPRVKSILQTILDSVEVGDSITIPADSPLATDCDIPWVVNLDFPRTFTCWQGTEEEETVKVIQDTDNGPGFAIFRGFAISFWE